MGDHGAGGTGRLGRGASGDPGRETRLSEQDFRAHWWAAVASVTRLVGDLATAEDAVQDACLAALVQWPAESVPDNPRAWLIGVARHKALDRIRRDARRAEKEAAAVREWAKPGPPQPGGPVGDDQLALIFMCCHPALDPATRVALTLRSVCGLSTAEVAAVLLVGEPAMARRLTRAKHKIRDAGIPMRVPAAEALPGRLDAVLRVIYLVFTEGHKTSTGPALVRGDLCDAAIDLARNLAALLPGEPEVIGLLALLLLTDARRAARYQLHAAIAACHSTTRRAAETDWRQIALLYGELIRYEPTPVIEANRAIAVAMAEGPAAGLVILDALGHHPQIGRWPQYHLARADLLRRLGRDTDARDTYRTALQLDPSVAERTFIAKRLTQLEP